MTALSAPEVAEQSERVGAALVEQGEYLLQLGRDLLKQSALLRHEKPQEPVQHIHGLGADHSVGASGLVTLERAQGAARELKRFTRTQLGDTLGLKGMQTNKWLAQLLEKGWIERAIDEETHATVFDYARKLEDEDPLYQVRRWAQDVGVQFTGEQAVEGTELPSDDVAVALTQLVTEGVLTTGQIDTVDDLGEITELGETVYRYAPPIPAGLAGKLERARLEAVTAPVEIPGKGERVRIRTERKTARKRSTPGSRQKLKNQERAWQRQQEAREAKAAKDARRARNVGMSDKTGGGRKPK